MPVGPCLDCPYSFRTKKKSFSKESITILCLEGVKMDLFTTEPDIAFTSLTMEENKALKLHLVTR